MNKRTKLFISLCLMLMAMSLTWFFSGNTGEVSNTLSMKLVIVMRDFLSRFTEVNPEDLFWERNLNWILRKMGHMAEYALIGLFSVTFFDVWFEKLRYAVPIAMITSFTWAVLDEFRQTYVDGRTGQWFDVRVDMIGAMSGIFIGIVILWLVHTIGRLKAQIRTIRS